MTQQIQETYPVSKQSNFFERLENFELLNINTNWDCITHQDFHLPATKEKHDWCNTWAWKGCADVEVHTCLGYHNKIEAKSFKRHCYRPDCIECYKFWIVREANKATRRIERYEGLSGLPAKHVIVSPPSWLHGEDVVKLRKEALKIVKSVNAEGGAIITHPFRQEKIINVFSEENRNWFVSPHFHIVGFGWIDGTAEAFKKNGWIVKNKGVRDSVFSTFCYLLSHAGIKKGVHTVIWFGSCSYSKLKIEKEPRTEFCTICGGDYIEIVNNNPELNKPPSVELIVLLDSEGWHPKFASSLYYANRGVCFN